MAPSATEATARVVSAHAWRPLAGARDPDALLARLASPRSPGAPGGGPPGAPGTWLLESTARDERRGRFTLLGADPYLVLSADARAHRVALDVRRDARPDLAPGRRSLRAEALATARALLPPPPPDDVRVPFPFVGGAVGVLGYELAEQLAPLAPLRLPARAPDDPPDLTLLYVDWLVALEAATGRAWVSALGFGRTAAEARGRAHALAERQAAVLAPPPGRLRRTPPPGRRGWTPQPASFPVALPAVDGPAPSAHHAAAYEAAVAFLLERIGRGDLYQACLTDRTDRDFRGDPWDLYRALRDVNPAPFAAFLALPHTTVVSSSPERFLRVDLDGRVESRPIKGTRPRGATPRADAEAARALRTSAKDRAENLMIVDLVRNDLGRVCEVGSVRVPELFAVEAYASVFQLVSTIEGGLAPGCDALDAVEAAFPPGSMTGAPKRAAMQLLAGLEPRRRGVYSGALGWFDLRGSADLSVVIRTLLVVGDQVRLHAGGGIVADSDPRDEYAERWDKLRALEAALARVSRRPPADDAAGAGRSGS